MLTRSPYSSHDCCPFKVFPPLVFFFSGFWCESNINPVIHCGIGLISSRRTERQRTCPSPAICVMRWEFNRLCIWCCFSFLWYFTVGVFFLVIFQKKKVTKPFCFIFLPSFGAPLQMDICLECPCHVQTLGTWVLRWNTVPNKRLLHPKLETPLETPLDLNTKLRACWPQSET